MTNGAVFRMRKSIKKPQTLVLKDKKLPEWSVMSADVPSLKHKRHMNLKQLFVF